MALFISTFIQFFFLFAPFFVVSMFLALTRGHTTQEKRATINRAVLSAALISLVLFFFGTTLFEVLGITLDSFRIGAGCLLFLSAVSLVKDGVRNHATGVPEQNSDDISVVPLAIPTIIGPATIGAILVYGAELKTTTETLIGVSALMVALMSLGALLHASSQIERILGKTGLNILSKMTGLILSAMAAQIVFSGIKNFLNL
ncbi:MarC family protein [Oceanospirillum sanctuarii]|uniref:MarC family protein n=1 Tax=Oceanospirillum sanctuarii TaxID=1434821 RepID=UPI000A395A64|nr:MarC family protein [Oceanospirillum sanctuarii]